jgi:hypothetical protein
MSSEFRMPRAASLQRSLEALRQRCDEKLKAALLPDTSMSLVEFDERGRWRPAATGAPFPLGYSGGVSRWAARELAKPFSDEWYAAQIGGLCADVLEAKKLGYSDDVVRGDLIDIGRWIDHRQSRPYRRFAQARQKMRDGSSAGGRMRAKQQAEKMAFRLGFMKDLKSKHPDAGDSDLARWASERGHGTEAANRQLLYRRSKAEKL